MQARAIATCFALAGFAAVAVIGVYVNNPAPTILWRGVVVGVIAFVIGAVIGQFAQGTIEGYVDRYRTVNPVPETGAGDNPVGGASDSQNTDAETVVASNG